MAPVRVSVCDGYIPKNAEDVSPPIEPTSSAVDPADIPESPPLKDGETPEPPVEGTPAPEPTPAPTDDSPASPPDDQVTTGIKATIVHARTDDPIPNAQLAVDGGGSARSGAQGGLPRIEVDWGALPKESWGLLSLARVSFTVTADGYGSVAYDNVPMYCGNDLILTVWLKEKDQHIDMGCLPRVIAGVKPGCEHAANPPESTLAVPQPAVMPAAKLAAPDATCTNPYYSDVTPPPEVRVLNNHQWDPPDWVGDGTVWTRDFKVYVKEVLPAEWGSGSPMASLQAGAMAARNFGWWWVNNGPYYGGTPCYDIQGWTNSQAWVPGLRYSDTDEAVDSIWQAARMTRAGIVFQSYYKAGSVSDTCGEWYARRPAGSTCHRTAPMPARTTASSGLRSCGSTTSTTRPSRGT